MEVLGPRFFHGVVRATREDIDGADQLITVEQLRKWYVSRMIVTVKRQ